MHQDSTTNANLVLDTFCEFLEVAFQYVLHSRKLYPDAIFESKRKYGIVVYQSRHPEINEYILNCIKAVRFHLQRNQLRDISLCFSASGEVVEKYSFQILSIGASLDSDPFLVQLEQYFSDFCLKLHSSVSCLHTLPDDSSFSVELRVTEYSNLELRQDPTFENFLWVKTRDKNTATEIVPIQSIETDFLSMQIFIETTES